MEPGDLKPGDLKPATLTHCPYCAFQCGMELVGTVGSATVAADAGFPVNKGALCIKGWTSADALAHPERLLTPLVRDASGELVPATWDEALSAVVNAFRKTQAEHGSDAVGIFSGGSLTNEKSYLIGKFARVAHPNIDYTGRFCMSSAAAAGIRALGVDRGLPFPLEDIPNAEAILLVGGNPAATMPPIMQYFEAQRDNGGRLIVADPRFVAAPRLRRRPGQRPAARPHRAEPHRRRLYREPHRGLRPGEGNRRDLLAGAGGAHYRRTGSRSGPGRAHPGTGQVGDDSHWPGR